MQRSVCGVSRRTATIYRSPDRVEHYGVEEEIDLSDAVPGWRVAVADFFA